MNKNPFSLHVDLDDFLPATEEEKAYMVQMRPSTTFFKDGMRRLKKNPLAMGSIIVLALIISIQLCHYLQILTDL